MAIPNLLHEVEAARQRYPEAWANAHTGNAHTEDFNRLLARDVRAVHGPRWGMNGKRGNPHDLSDDVLAYADEGTAVDARTGGPMEIIDVIAGAGGPNPQPAWIVGPGGPGDVGTVVTDFTVPETPPGPTPSPVKTKLGVSWFPAVGLRLHDRARYEEELAFFATRLKPDTARIFFWLDDPPWAIVGTAHLPDALRTSTLRLVIGDLLERGIAPQVTVFGAWVPDHTRRRQLTDHCLIALQPVAQHIFLVDAVNEPIAIGFASNPAQPYTEVREVTRWIVDSQIRFARLSPASPNSLHAGVDGRRATDAEVAADVEALVAGLPAAVNAITPHWGRNPWEPHRPLGQFAAGKLLINDEPRGFRSSVSAISAPRDFALDYLASVQAGDDLYNWHTEPGVWEGYCDSSTNPSWEVNNTFKRIQDIPDVDAIIDALHEVRETGTYDGSGGGGGNGGGGTPPTPVVRSILKPGERLLPGERLISPNRRWSCDYQGDGQLAIYPLDPATLIPNGDATWGAGTAGTSPGQVPMQGDGHLVIYTADMQAIWGSGTQGNPGAFAELTDAGTLRIVAPVAIWSVP